MNYLKKISTQIIKLLELYKWMLAILLKTKPLITSILLGVVVLQSIIPAVQIWITKLLVDEIVRYLSEPSGTFHIYDLLALEAGLVVLNMFLGAYGGYIQNSIGEYLGLNIHRQINEKSISLDMAYFEAPEYYDYLERAQYLAKDSPTILLDRLMNLLSVLLSLLSIATIVLIYNFYILLIILVSVVPSVLISLYYEKKHFDLVNNRVPDERLASYYTQIISSNQYAKEVKLWQPGSYLMNQWLSLKTRFVQENLDLVKKQAIGVSVGETASTGGYYLAYAFIITSVLSGQLTIGDLTLYIAAFMRIQSTFERLLTLLSRIYVLHFFIENLQHFLSFESTLITKYESNNDLVSNHEGLLVENLSFTYPNTADAVLTDISFEMSPGECMAIVGKNGSGKSTLVKLLLNLYNPDCGHIYLQGLPLESIQLNEKSRYVSAVFQDYARYYLSAQENIGIGNISAIENDAFIYQIAQQSGADTIIQGLPHGYQTILGRYFENGHELSLGQWQKVALARALASDSKLLILDEPTAAMDPQAEAEFYTFVSDIVRSQQKMILLISHRYSTVRMADRILVMDGGQIIERGTHEELVNADTLYSHLYNTQAQSYKD